MSHYKLFTYLTALLCFCFVAEAKPKTARRRPAQQAQQVQQTPAGAPKMILETPRESSVAVSASADDDPKEVKMFTAELAAMQWTEVVPVKSMNQPDDFMVSRFQGAQVTIKRSTVRSGSKWVPYIGGQFSFGFVNGKPSVTAATVDNKSWFAAAGLFGISYRSSPSSRLGLVIPVGVRSISWAVEPGVDFDPDRDAGFYFGIGTVFEMILSKRSTAVFTLTHQHMWQTAQWTARWQYRYR